MKPFGALSWKATPFVRILLPLIAGIITRFYLTFPFLWLMAGGVIGLLLLFSGKLFSAARFYMLRWMPGIGVHLVFFCLGALLAVQKDIRQHKDWIGNHYQQGDAVIVTIEEPLTEKPRSYKAQANIESVIKSNTTQKVAGKLLIYFQKDSLPPAINYGTQLLLVKPLQTIINSGNPGGFDYKRYCAFQDIYYQAFLKDGDYRILHTTKTNWFDELMISTRTKVLSVLKQNIHGKNELAVAEALLIGYKNDLDRELVQSYSNTGVVHIIAISGLHLGMIYGLMLWLFSPFKQKRWNRFVQPLVILFVIWMFTFLAGAVPSILRSAVMFTCIIVGQALSKKSSIYNTLAASAFLLLLYNPFYLWDVGFQLSFAAVLSIVAFSRHITKWFYIQNKLLRSTWSLCAVTLSAQILTLPVILYHFHQFPNLFLFTNMLIVPLSGLILFAELLLLLACFIPVLAEITGKVVEWLTWLMNTLIERTDRIPFALTDGIKVSIPEAIFIYGAVITTAMWFLRKNRQLLLATGCCLLAFVAFRSFDVWQSSRQQKLIVYNVPQHTAIDVVEGNRFCFLGDSILLEDGFVRNFHLKPSRILNRINEAPLNSVFAGTRLIRSNSKKVVIIDRPLAYKNVTERIKADVLIITKNPRLYIDQLKKLYDCDLLVFDASNPTWKIRLWKKDCDNLHLRFHSVPEQGAFEMDL